jgi:hypothetical protein
MSVLCFPPMFDEMWFMQWCKVIGSSRFFNCHVCLLLEEFLALNLMNALKVEVFLYNWWIRGSQISIVRFFSFHASHWFFKRSEPVKLFELMLTSFVVPSRLQVSSSLVIKPSTFCCSQSRFRVKTVKSFSLSLSVADWKSILSGLQES